MINVHITDDHAMIVELLIPVINDSKIACVTGFSYKLSDCRKALAANLPDVLLLDINMPDGNGILFCSEIHKLYPKMKIIALTGHDEHSSVIQILKNGASGYIVKSEAVCETINAIYAVMQGEIYICDRMEQVMRKTTTEAVSLTPREKQILQMIAKGMRSTQIAEKLGIDIETVFTFRKKLNLKIGSSNPVELITKARKLGLIE